MKSIEKEKLIGLDLAKIMAACKTYSNKTIRPIKFVWVI